MLKTCSGFARKKHSEWHILLGGYHVYFSLFTDLFALANGWLRRDLRSFVELIYALQPAVRRLLAMVLFLPVDVAFRLGALPFAKGQNSVAALPPKPL